jgi:hypothetical protein
MGFIIWLCLSFLVGIIGKNRNCGFWGAFILSVILSPLIGLVITLLFNKKKTQTELLNEANILLNSGAITSLEHAKMVEDIMTNGKLDKISKYRNKNPLQS